MTQEEITQLKACLDSLESIARNLETLAASSGKPQAGKAAGKLLKVGEDLEGLLCWEVYQLSRSKTVADATND